MKYLFSVSPDFAPAYISGWFVFNTWLQRTLGEVFHLEMHHDFCEQRELLNADKIDLIYANPYDAAMLVREKGFVPLVKPVGGADEAIIAVNAKSGVNQVEALVPGARVATTDDPDVHMIGMIMLEPADLDSENIEQKNCGSFILVAKQLINNNADVGIFLAGAYDELSQMVRDQLRVLVRSQIQLVHHSMMVGPRLAPHKDKLLASMLAMNDRENGQRILSDLDFTAWAAIDAEEMEFMIDLVDTLLV